LVTHGVQWLPDADNIVVLADGTVSECGSYEELISHNGAFAQFLKTYFLTGKRVGVNFSPPLSVLRVMNGSFSYIHLRCYPS